MAPHICIQQLTVSEVVLVGGWVGDKRNTRRPPINSFPQNRTVFPPAWGQLLARRRPVRRLFRDPHSDRGAEIGIY